MEECGWMLTVASFQQTRKWRLLCSVQISKVRDSGEHGKMSRINVVWGENCPGKDPEHWWG